MNEQDALEKKVRSWLDSQGYPLEMAVAEKLRSLGLNIRQGWHYDDVEEGVSREIDVVASKIDLVGGSTEIHFVIECKATSKPWIIFTNERTGDGINIVHTAGLLSKGAREYFFSGRNLPFEINYDDYKNYFHSERLGYAITQAFGESKDPTYQALMSCFKASLSILSKSPWFGDDKSIKWVFVFPAIITNSPLFECYLDDKNEMQLIKVDSADFLFTKRIDGHRPTKIKIVSSDALDMFSTWASELSDKIFDGLKDDMRGKLESDLGRPLNRNT